ncbi:hypothetical protein [Methylotetracoccus oryzae]|uniref:hypothetical protein n=1 Tax=Methylotetracoccus oryzae TaxID=1919059 RepID=UPI00111B3A38|nr:hypothetical protein [Methylotetracoccus oryzae]
MKTNKLNLAIALILSGAMTTSVAFAARPPGVGGGGGGGGGGGETVAAQNLSVPAILVGSLGTLICGTEEAPTALVPPTSEPLTGYEVPGYYYVQKVHTWQAQCFNAPTASVFGAWGDNLTGDASLKTGSPIRVELVLTNTGDFSGSISNGTLKGYSVIKLEPSRLDRESAYGHLAGGDSTSGWTDIPVDVGQASWVVHDAGMQISVQHVASGTYTVPIQAIAPEINATGKIVYGYNLRVTAAGTYQIRFHAPNVTFTGTDALHELNDANNAYLDIVVSGGGGGGGKKGGRTK